MRKLIFIGLVLSLFLLTGNGFAADVYIRETGSGDGSAWNNALDDLPATLTRGNTYYIADGSYSGYNFNDAADGTNVITIKKATAAAHGTETGWSSGYGDGQAIFGGLQFTTDYYVIDGVSRNESNWRDSTGYGFRAWNAVWNTSWNPTVGSHITLQYMDIGGTVSEFFDEAHPDAAVYFGGFTAQVYDVTVSHCRLHNVDICIHLAGIDGAIIEYCYMGPSWTKETIRGMNIARNIIIRHNILVNGSQIVSGDPPDGRVACTAQIGIWDRGAYGGTDNFDNCEIYGNVIASTIACRPTDALIFVGSSVTPPEANYTKVYNNSFYGFNGAQTDIDLPGTDTQAYNNLAYGVITNFNVYASTVKSNILSATNPYENVAATNFVTISAQPGFSISSPYNTDLLGVTRGSDGTFDIGAYEFGGVTNPPVIINYPLTASATNGVYFSVAISCSNTPTSYGLGGTILPTGLSLDTATGIISGTPAAAGAPLTTNILISATNSAGYDQETLVFSVYEADGAAPTITLTSPTNGSTVGGTITISATAADDIGVASVQWYLDGVSLAIDYFDPYTYNWNTYGTAHGSHTIAAVASDASANQTWSATNTITITNNIARVTTLRSGNIYIGGPVGGSSNVTFSDDFNRVDSADIGTNWTILSGLISNQVNKASSVSLNYTNMSAAYVTPTSTGDQYVKITIDGTERLSVGIYPEILLRVNGSLEHYGIQFQPNESLVKWRYYASAGSSGVEIASTASTVGETDTWAVTITGTGTSTIVRAWRNPTGLASSATDWNGDTSPDVSFSTDPVDAADNGRQVGFGGFANDIAHIRWDDFYGGDL